MQTGFRTNFSWKRGFSMMLLTLFSFSVAVAQVLVRGTVVDQTGESVPGASIQIKGGTQGTITDLDGKFSLNAPNKKSILIAYQENYIVSEVQQIASLIQQIAQMIVLCFTKQYILYLIIQILCTILNNIIMLL